ncbi:hypothetical protein CPB84DRAFT_1841895 [Gymnopilus junonius]|uniref:F-box domain-containing protein n=1 Tax=Gymnopilus junonius TaxID=109634 RepID=A0A9P5P016_GYMJU|nr:hypothetical protein CPB84DRAFT_1841895 [Gymnopilus junonius]
MNAVSSDARLAPLIRTINLCYSSHLYKHSEDEVVKAANDSYKPFVQTFIQVCSKFVNLRQVNIDFDKNMDKTILISLASLPHLDVIVFTSARFGAHLLKPRLNLKTLVIDNTRLKSMRLDPNPNSSAKLLDIVSVARLECIQSYSWTYTPKLFRALTKQGISDHLVHLTFQLRAENVDVLYPFLATCPNLLHLSIASESYPSSNLPPLPPLPHSTISRLTYLRCPCTVAKAFVPRRPIVKLCLTHPSYCSDHYTLDKIEEIIPKVSQIKGYLTTLDIQNIMPFPQALCLIATHLPRLQILRLGLGHRMVIINGDPNTIDLETVTPRDQLLSGMRQADTLGFKADVFLLPIDLHVIYMDFIHWVALKKIDLPPALKVLELRTSWHRPSSRKPYTIRNALSIFHAMSIRFPEVEHLEVHAGVQRLEWRKDKCGAWITERLADAARDQGDPWAPHTK